MRYLLAIFGAPILVVAASRPYSVERYSADLRLDLEHKRLEGTESIRLRCLGEVREIELDVNEIAVDAVRKGGRAQEFSQTPGHVTVRLKRVLQTGERFHLKVAFHGEPAKGLRISEHEAYAAYGTSHWLVVNHVPDDLATLRLALTVPAAMTVVANGENVASKVTNGNLVSVWEEKRKIPDFVFGFAVGRFAESAEEPGKTAIRSLSAKYDAAQMSRMFRGTPTALDFFAQKAGVAYPARTYSQVMVTGDPEQELGEFTLLPESYGETLLGHPDEEWLMAHELAHQWWGIGLACREWGEFWLNEGTATFMADVFLGERYGPARYEHEIELARQSYEQLKADGKDHALCYAGKAENEVGGRLPYNKGAWVLHLLRQQLGDDVFWPGFKNYTQANWGRAVTSKDLQTAMEKAAGRSLEAFFQEWVYR